MRFLSKTTVILSVCIPTLIMAADAVVWNIDNLSSIGGNAIEVSGSPKVIDTEIGKAVEFNGKPDRLLIKNNPLDSSTVWTIELIIKPYDIASSAALKEPRCLHLENPEYSDYRITMEMRYSSKDWYFDGYIKSPENNLPLIDEKLTHNVDEWYNITMAYENTTFTTFVNGVKELTGNVTYKPVSDEGVVSLGCRMNKVSYFKGAIKKVIWTKAVLTPDQFDKSYLLTTTKIPLRIQQGISSKNKISPIITLNNRSPSGKFFSLAGRAVYCDTHVPVVSNGIVIGVGDR